MKKKNLTENILELIRNKKPLRVIYGGDDFGIYHFVEDKGYQGQFGYIPTKSIIKIINGTIDFIEFREIGD